MGADRVVHAVDRAAPAAPGSHLKLDRTLVAIGVAGVALAAIPFAGLPEFYTSFLYLVLHWIVLATSWNILSGYCGYFSFGHGAFYGAGVYASAVLAASFDVPFLWTLPVAALVAALLGVGIGAVVFRVRSVRGELFALLTLAVTFVLATLVLNTPIDGGPGIYLSAVPVPRLAPSAPGSFYLMALVLAVVTLGLAHGIARSRLGLGLFAIHDDEDAAEVVGVPTYRAKLVALGVSAALAGVAGGIQALYVSYVTAGSTFNITVPLTVVLMSVLGGTRHWAGPAIGATAITLLLYASTAADQAVIGKAVTGAILVVAVLFLPDGVLGGRRRTVPARSGETTPAKRTPSPAAPLAPARDTARRHTDAPSLLVVRGLAKSFKGVQALAGVDLDVHEGEILGIVGPNGSGKSTLINVVSGHYRANAGTIRFAGVDLTGRPAHCIARAGIARTYQIPRPFPHLSVRDNVALAAVFGRAALESDAARDEAMHALAFTGLAARAAALPDELNLHQKKFLELARALAARPRLLMLDEVLSGLTPAEIDDAIALVRRICDGGTTIVLVEHVIRVVTELSDRVVVLDQGRVLATGEANEVMTRSDVAVAYLGVAHA
ncbi:MAG TPA: branched-chain amino acid ABC transporter ATP-binding protein/permease [Casimicrobiaceae bacterium]|nr:branched-chain amino acid ABC transporter ATP-binding protein/permease [Casimicrobiaceae bacterium]